MWALASHGGYLWQFVHSGRRYATYLQREIQTVPVRSEDGDSRLGGRGLLQARPGVTARAAVVVEGRRSVPIWGTQKIKGFLVGSWPWSECATQFILVSSGPPS